ncbi:cytochrome P450 [Azorhizobium doebereinerae]|uniref:cytochrome P450 n=1 Tax=Azorhizobium doebereinerae TaxID=281091 RepID=UPI000A014FBF|nr:cytochrome P450 [Azorhizobium doebereinerae]
MSQSDFHTTAPAATALEAPGIDWWTMLTDPAYLESPYAELKRIRDLGAVHHDAVSGVYFVLGHNEFRQMATAPEMGRDTRLWANGWNAPESRVRDPLGYELFREFQPQMTNMNPPDHRRMREVYEKAFSPARLAGFLPMIQAESERLLDAVPAGVPVDFMSAFANPLARAVSRKLFHIPPEMGDLLGQWVEALSLLGNVIMTPDQKREAQAALRAFKAYLRDAIAARGDAPGEGFVGLALAALADGTMDEEETLTNLVTLISGGTATATLLGNGLLALLRHPRAFGQLRADRGLIRPAIEEMLRYEPGGSFILRVAIRDYACGGMLIPAGSLAIGLVGAINRDPIRFEDPDVFDITRQPNAHLVFGAGPHICLGKALVRMTAEVAFASLLDRYGRIELAGPPVWWTHRSDQHGLHSLPLRLASAQ